MRGHLTHHYLIALGSNRRHPRHGRPRDVLSAALEVMAEDGLKILAVAPVLLTDPVGPSHRRYANRAAIVESKLDPPAMLALLKRIERQFGRRPGGQRWTARVLDLDVVLWSGGSFAEPGLTIPHPLFRQRDFVLRPAAEVAGTWRDPLTSLTVRQLLARLTRPRPLPR